MERGDLLRDNGNIFRGQGQAINKTADRSNLRVVVVGNPANTNAWIASQNAPDIDPKCFTAMTRLDHNRGLAQLSERTGFGVSDIHKFAIWGNHSSTQYPDVNHATVGGKSLKEVINDDQWTKEVFIPTVSVHITAVGDLSTNGVEIEGRNQNGRLDRPICLGRAFHKYIKRLGQAIKSRKNGVLRVGSIFVLILFAEVRFSSLVSRFHPACLRAASSSNSFETVSTIGAKARSGYYCCTGSVLCSISRLLRN